MDTKEAIKWLEDFIDSADKGYSISFGHHDILDFRNIVKLLERGEEYKRILKHIKAITINEQVKRIINDTFLGG